MRVNYEEVFEKKWSNLSKTAGDSDITTTDFIPYTDLREAFGQLFTNPYDSNLPQREVQNIKILTYNYPGDVGSNTTTSWATNRTLKSFIYDNVAIVFKVKGQPYRVPGKFIRINTDQPTEANKTSSSSSTKSCAKTGTDESAEADSLNGWWYVISVQHIFENDIYFNRITAVKIYSPVEIPNLIYGTVDDGGAASTSGSSSKKSRGTNIDTTSPDPEFKENTDTSNTDTSNTRNSDSLPELPPDTYVIGNQVITVDPQYANYSDQAKRTIATRQALLNIDRAAAQRGGETLPDVRVVTTPLNDGPSSGTNSVPSSQGYRVDKPAVKE